MNTAKLAGFPAGSNIIAYRISAPLRIFSGLSSAILVFGLIVSWVKGGFGQSVVGCSILFGMLGIVHIQQLGYRVAWDDNNLYWRRWGILNGLGIRPQIAVVPWMTVTGVITSAAYIFGRSEDYRPDEFLEFKIGRKVSDRVRAYPYMMSLDDFEQFAAFVRDKLGVVVELG